jgi:hypothetical protein
MNPLFLLFLRFLFTQIISWNDSGESHHIGLLNDFEYITFDNDYGKTSFNYALNMLHDGWSDFLLYLVDTSKNDKVTITREGAASWCYINPAAACAHHGTIEKTAR